MFNPKVIRLKEPAMTAETPQVCPICRRLHRDPLEIEAEILHILHRLEHSRDKSSTKAVSVRLHLSMEQTRRYLRQMEVEGEIRRIGRRGGWRRLA